jgi:pimeloyl-ACP methyl ester carboxylesterase
MSTHAADLFTVMDALGVAEAAVIGWSMGCQVGLEAIRLRPSAIRGFVMLSGTYGRPFDDSAVRAVAPVLPAVWKTFARFPAPAQALLGAVQSNNRLLLPLLDLIRFKTAAAEPEVFLTQVACTASVETRTYMRTMLELSAHDAWDVLTDVRCPTLVLACRKDILTPAAVARRIAATIPNARCVVLEGLSHFGLIEDPDRVHAELDPFLASLAVAPVAAA